MSAPNPQLRAQTGALQTGAMTNTQFKRPDGCPFSMCSAIAMYEAELGRHQETEAKLRESLSREIDLLTRKEELILQKDTLSKEFEHRLLNGLQLVTSLLRLQSLTAANAEAAAQLTNAAYRVSTLARVHRHLHSLDNTEHVEFKAFLVTLCDDLAGMAWGGHLSRSLVVEGTELRIPAITAVPLGFIACEIITNSIKHATGRIVVQLHKTPEHFALSVSDDGEGLPQDFDPAATKGLGMKLITTLAKQIGGVLEIGKGERGQGTRFTVRFVSHEPLGTPLSAH